MKDFVEIQVLDSVGYITFGTEKSNSLPGRILDLLAETILKAGQDPEVKILVLKSVGERAFCAGASFDELLEVENLQQSQTFFLGFAKVLQAMKNCGKIIVARVQGKVTGGGVGIVCAADYVFATEAASLALTEINLGIGPFVIAPFVERKIGVSQLLAMSLDAEFRSAQWACQNHIYHQVFEDISKMDTEMENFVKQLSGRSAKALSLLKKNAWEGTEHFSDLMPSRAEMSGALILEKESKESIQRIKEKLRKK